MKFIGFQTYALGLKVTIALLSVLLLVGGWTGPSYAQTTPTKAPNPTKNYGIKLELKAGFEGNFKVNEWVPVQVTLSWDKASVEVIKGRVELSTTDFDQSSNLYSHTLELAPPARKSFWMYVMGRDLGYNLQARLVREDGQIVAQNNATLAVVSESTFLMGVVSDDPSAIKYLDGKNLAQPASNSSSFLYSRYSGSNNKANSLRGTTPTVKVVHLNPEDLPPSGAGLSALDGLVFSDLSISNLNTNNNDKINLYNAITSWLSQGKALIVAGDSALQHAEILHNLLPVQDDGGPVTISDLSDLQKQSKATTPFDLSSSGVGITTAKVKLIQNLAGSTPTILSQDQNGLPLIVTRSFGLGQVWFIAPELKPLESWKDITTLWSWLLNDYQLRMSYASMARHVSNEYEDLNDLLPIVRRDNSSDPLALIIFLLIYIGVVGPANYYILRRVGRPALIWLTLPLLTFLFSVGAFIIGSNTGASDLVASRINILTVGQTNDGNFSGASNELATIYSNGRNHFKLKVNQDTLSIGLFPHDQYLYTGNYFGNYSGNQASNIDETDSLEQGPDGGYPNLNILAHDNRTYSFESDNANQLVTGGLVGQISYSGSILTGTVENRSNVEWDDVCVFSRRRVVKLGDIKPGQKVQLGTLSNNAASLVNTLTDYTGTRNNIPNYYGPTANRVQTSVDITKQKAFVLDSLFGSQGEGLKSDTHSVYIIGWNESNQASFQPQNLKQTNKSLTLIFEPLNAN